MSASASESAWRPGGARLGSEPYTEAKARVIHEVGCKAAPVYAMTEIGTIGVGCAAPIEVDDHHLLHDKIAAIQRPRKVGPTTVDALVYTTVLNSCPKLMLNVESDDYAVMRRRRCGCSIGELGLDRHLWQIRSYEKLTSEGVTFLGTELYRLLEEVLPATLGGDPNDYQLVEQEQEGVTRVSLLISPHVGAVDDTRAINTVLSHLRRYPGGEVMANEWKQARTLRVIRQQPHDTSAGKILPLHILEPR
jgi:phenylacetate-coenzyme A ligase PaaK-like adenylate-forming protein